MPARSLLDKLRGAGLRLAVAESCTGGRLMARIVDEPGASDVFLGGVVAYDDDVKATALHVDPNVIHRFGAVSAATAEAMAHGVRDALQADVALAVTGIAGPEGGAPGKPVGTVWIAALGPGNVLIAHKAHFDGTRHEVQEQAVDEALTLAFGNVEEAEREGQMAVRA